MPRRPAQNSGAERPRRKPPRGRPFPKGVSGNPGGVPKEAREFKKALIEEHGQTILNAFMKLVRKGNAIAVVRGVEHVIGKPTQAVELTGKDGKPIETKTTGPTLDPRKLTNEQLEQLDAILAAAADEGGGEGGAGTEEPPPLRP